MQSGESEREGCGAAQGQTNESDHPPASPRLLLRRLDKARPRSWSPLTLGLPVFQFGKEGVHTAAWSREPTDRQAPLLLPHLRSSERIPRKTLKEIEHGP